MAARDAAMALSGDGPAPSYTAVAQRLLNGVLFVTILASSLAFIEPSPHDVLMFVLLVACAAARVPFDRKLTPLLLLIIVWLIGGAMSLIQVAGDKQIQPDVYQDPVQYFGISVYLGVAAIMFGCLFSEGSLVRLAILRRAYILAALIATVAGFIGYFHLLPGSNVFLITSEDAASTGARIRATFKDPNVYGPFLVFPLMMLLLRSMTRGVGLGTLLVTPVLLAGLLLSFSRGAWVHFALSALVAVVVTFVTVPSARMRLRIVLFAVIAAMLITLLFVALASVGSIHEMLAERAKAIQPYDVGSGGRFSLQELALTAILENPNGMGPFAFANTFGAQQHNVYLQAFLVYGWLGGSAYLALVLITLVIGLASVRQPTPWQPYLIAAFATYVGEIGEGLIVDTDHWRHFFLVLGLVWGLAAANANQRRASAWQTERPVRLGATAGQG
jgi:O-antigen ligase